VKAEVAAKTPRPASIRRRVTSMSDRPNFDAPPRPVVNAYAIRAAGDSATASPIRFAAA